MTEADSSSTIESNSAHQLGFPESILYYLKQNAPPKLLLKLMQASKYFCYKEFPFLVVEDLAYAEEEWKYRLLKSDAYETFHLEDVTKKLWITEDLKIIDENRNAASTLISKIAVCDIRLLNLNQQEINLNELHFFNSHQLRYIDFTSTTVTDSDGTILTLDKLLQNLPNLGAFSYAFPDDHALTLKSDSTKNFIEWLKSSGITDVTLEEIPETFDIDVFFQFMSEKPSINFLLRFRDGLSVEYVQKLQAYADQYLEYRTHRFIVYFPGQTMQSIILFMFMLAADIEQME